MTGTAGEATDTDLDAWFPPLAQLTTDQKTYVLPRREAAEAMLAWATRSPDVTLLVAEADGRVVGTVTAALIPILVDGARPFMILEAMVVDEGVRRSGVG